MQSVSWFSISWSWWCCIPSSTSYHQRESDICLSPHDNMKTCWNHAGKISSSYQLKQCLPSQLPLPVKLYKTLHIVCVDSSALFGLGNWRFVGLVACFDCPLGFSEVRTFVAVHFWSFCNPMTKLEGCSISKHDALTIWKSIVFNDNFF